MAELQPAQLFKIILLLETQNKKELEISFYIMFLLKLSGTTQLGC